jgi:hypothetical protein
VFGDPIRRITHYPGIQPHGFARQATARHKTPQGGEAVRDIPEETIAPPAYFMLPEVLQLSRRDGAQVDHLYPGRHMICAPTVHRPPFPVQERRGFSRRIARLATAGAVAGSAFFLNRRLDS